jgi:hypothetical protein
VLSDGAIRGWMNRVEWAKVEHAQQHDQALAAGRQAPCRFSAMKGTFTVPALAGTALRADN